MDRLVRAEAPDPAAAFQRWRTARRAAVLALSQADPQRPLRWASAPLRPRTLATTRLAEHWAHGLDIAGPLGISFPDTNRLSHVAWLGYASMPYALALIGEERRDVFCELTGPDGDFWRFGSPAAGAAIRGTAAAFCRVGARRLPPEASGLITSGPYGAAALRALRNYAA